MKVTTGAGIVGLCLACASALGQVELRSRERLSAAVEDASLVGLRVAPESAGAGAQVVSWDRVKKVEGAAGGKVEAFAPVMDRLWRARTRVERGDFDAAEPLVDDLHRTYGGEEGPSAAVVAECLMRCRLARGAQGAATSAWLWWTGLMERKAVNTAAGGKTPGATWIGGSTDLPAIIDPATRLAPLLPPVWTPGAATQTAAREADWAPLRAKGGVSGELAMLYEKAARFEAGMDAEVTLPESATGDLGVAIVREMVLARAGDVESRAAARVALARRLAAGAVRGDATKPKVAPLPGWLEAWCRIGLGRSMIREEDTSTRVRGVIELLHLPARFGADYPNLAGIALADAAVTMAELGDTEAATALKVELMAKFPNHPVLAWEALMKISMPTGARNEQRSRAGGVNGVVVAGEIERAQDVLNEKGCA